MVDLDIISPSLESKEIIQHLRAENDSLQHRLDMENWTITYLEQRNKQLEEEHTLDELRRIHEDRNLARKRPDDLVPDEREAMLLRVNAHLERLLAKANQDKNLLRNMKNHYWARMHVCKAIMKVLQRRFAKAQKRRKRSDPLHILAEASLKEHGTK